MNCPKCQRTLPELARFCPYCQAQILQLVKPPPQEENLRRRPTGIDPLPNNSSSGNLFGILSIVCSFIGIFILGIIFGPAAIILGILGLRQQKNDILSIIGIVIGSIVVILVGIYFTALGAGLIE